MKCNLHFHEKQPNRLCTTEENKELWGPTEKRLEYVTQDRGNKELKCRLKHFIGENAKRNKWPGIHYRSREDVAFFLVQQLHSGECGDVPCRRPGDFGEEREGADGIPCSSIWQRWPRWTKTSCWAIGFFVSFLVGQLRLRGLVWRKQMTGRAIGKQLLHRTAAS
jgi:hypothetical protein